MVVIQDVLTHEVTATWKWVMPGDGRWNDEENRATKQVWPHVTTKAMAVSVAKGEALRRGLPFDLQADVLDEAEATKGPVQLCIVCRQSTQARSFAPLVCQSCLVDMKVGQVACSEKHTWLMHFSDLLPYVSLGESGSFRAWEERFGMLLVAIAGSATMGGGRHYGSEHEKRRIGGRHGDPGYPTEVMLPDSQGEAINELLVFLKDLVGVYEARGEASGSNLLGKLASGDISPVEFGLRRDEAKARSVKADLDRMRKYDE